MTPANLSSSILLLELPSFLWSSYRETVRQEDSFSLGVFLTHLLLVLSSCTPLQKRREGFAENCVALTELVLHFELFPVPLYSQAHYPLPISAKGPHVEDVMAAQSFTSAQSWAGVNST